MLVKVIDSVSNYEEAIRLSCEILEEKGIVEKRYYKSILNKIEELGPYFCIADGVCMPHARPEDGVIKKGLCILKLNNPVDFHGKMINVFFTLAANNNESHIEYLKKIAEVCMNKEKLNNIINSNKEKDIMGVF